ncbi:hypothetical protein [Treponema sp.]|uniref:LptM family lipoprotein n=1 Tax=Treponema sp. TaxID=166 RepID=UPI00298D9F3B|nr:hypothetical protein [Treponema sp.]MCQ2240642.1 hypothetical protein [Treponema sp.]
MKKIIYSALSAAIFAFTLAGCGSTTTPAAPVQEEPVIEEQAEVPAPVEEEEIPEEVLEEEPEVVEEIVPEQEDIEDQEYQRSTTNVTVTKETFVEDKTRILQIIEDLDTYMKNGDFKGWTSYLAPESYAYWTKKPNLTKAAQRLPKKGLRLNTIEDYFKFVFIPARRGRTVDEIRYDTKTEVNVVQVDDDKDIVYYTFTKINDKWKLTLPKNPN